MLRIISFGDTAVMLPAAAAIIAWLVAGGAWRMALWWCLLFTAGLSLVVASKIAFLAWGSGIRSLDFKALSGHAMLTTAIVPVIFYLLMQRHPPGMRTFGALLGILSGVVMGICLATLGFHSAFEATAGCVIGASVSLAFIWMSSALPALRRNRWLIPCSVLTFLAVSYAKPASMEHWITDVAPYLSGNEKPYNWITWERGR